MKSSKSMYDIVRSYAVTSVPVRHEGKLGYGLNMTRVNKIFFDNKFSAVRGTMDRYISEWIMFDLAMYDSDGDFLWIIDSSLKPRLIAEKKAHSAECKDLEVLG